MAIAAPDKLTLLPFPQLWEAGTLRLRLLMLPRGNPLQPLMTVPAIPDGPAFADADIRLKAILIPGLDALPSPPSPATEMSLTIATPPDLRALYEEIESQFDIDPTIEAGLREPRRVGRQILKFLPRSYRDAFPFAGVRTPFAVLDDSYFCALRNGCRLKDPGPPPTTRTVWGRILAQALRQPLLAQRMSLLHIENITPADPEIFADGGWLYLGLDDGSAYLDHVAARPQLLSAYAARIPPVTGAQRRVLFAPVLFPVVAAPPPGDFDEVQAEAAAYDDGFAKIVHGAQKITSEPTSHDIPGESAPIVDSGIQLGWDDEQLLIWQNRQIADPVVETRNTPMGVMGYRIDVREEGSVDWSSLMRAQAALVVGPHAIGTFEGELTVEVKPLQLDNREDGDYWMPAFFTEWRGRSLVTADATALQLSGVSAADATSDLYTPVDDEAVPLRYGRTYELRVRLGDISHGGPASDEDFVHPSPAPIATVPFRRHVPPREVIVDGDVEPIDPANPPAELTIHRPPLAYPAALLAGIPNAAQRLIDDVNAIRAAAGAGTTRGNEPGLPDPDVETVRITVSVVGLEFDSANISTDPPLREVYTTTREFPAGAADPLVLPLEYVDIDDIDALAPTPAGALRIPTSRDVVLTFTAVGREDENLDYFGSQHARMGRQTQVRLRSAPESETDLFVPDTDARRLRAILLQPDEAVTASLLAKLMAEGKGVESENEPVARLAAELGLNAEGASLAGRSGRRVVFGSSAALSHVLAPDRSVITFASKADLVKRWIHVLTIGVARDWTWRNGDRPAFDIERDGRFIGSIVLPNSVNPRVWEGSEGAGEEPDRSMTQLIFFDAVDPKPIAPAFPSETSHRYTITPRFKDAPSDPDGQDDPLSIDIDLPIAANPTQTPKILSAGIALSPYLRADDYSSTEPRERMLWIEFETPPENPRDALFGRVLSYTTDPMLTRNRIPDVPPEPPLPVDPEWIRVIRPGQSDDRAGLDAMQPLVPTTSARHWLVPLPPGLTRDSRELFGFFVYELRVGHFEGWSTAQARYGLALRVTGVQHPAPQLHCLAMRTSDSILVSAPYATPAYQGQNFLPNNPATELWFLLYAQVVQADAADHRNILLARRRGRLARRHDRKRLAPDAPASTGWSQPEVRNLLDTYGLPADNPLSVVAVELLPEAIPPSDPLGADLGEVRILRTSPLVAVSNICVQPPCPP